MTDPTRDELRALGFTVGTKGPLPPAAVAEWERRQAARPAPVSYDPAALTVAVDKLPSESARATLRFILAATLTRHSSGNPEDHPGVFMIGKEGTGKTTIGRAACILLGLTFRDHEKTITEKTSAPDVRGRRNGAGRMINPAPWQAGPVVFFDEVHKAQAGTLDAIQSEYLQGDRDVSTPTPILAANEGRHGIGLLPPDRLRRVLTVRTDGWGRQPMDRYRRQLGQLSPVVPLDLALPEPESPEAVWSIIDALEAKLTDAGRDVFLGVQFLAPLVPAYAALLGVGQPDAAELLCADYLACAATVGHVAALAVREPTPAELAAQEALDRAQERRNRVMLAGYRRRVQKAWLGPVLALLDRVLDLDRLDYLWEDAEDLYGQAEQLADEIDAADLAELQPRTGQVWLAVYDWRGRVSALLQPHDLTPDDPDEYEDEDQAEDQNVIESEAWETPAPEHPGPEPAMPDTDGLPFLTRWTAITGYVRARTEWQAQMNAWQTHQRQLTA